MNQSNFSQVHCEGWWEQSGLGRQSMEALRLTFDQGKIQGSGTDIIGPFTFSGLIANDGTVTLVKHYLGRHNVEYFGTYDGEGTLSGVWNIDGFRGNWMILIGRNGNRTASEEIQEFDPSG